MWQIPFIHPAQSSYNVSNFYIYRKVFWLIRQYGTYKLEWNSPAIISCRHIQCLFWEQILWRENGTSSSFFSEASVSLVMDSWSLVGDSCILFRIKSTELHFIDITQQISSKTAEVYYLKLARTMQCSGIKFLSKISYCKIIQHDRY